MEVEIVSRKLIVPSTPHKDHPQSIKLTLLDEIAGGEYVELILYYAETGGGGDNRERLTRMERSLADTLSVFYPFAGRYNENDASIDCNDQGVEFMEAKVSNCQLNELRDDPKLLSRLVPPQYQYWDKAPLVSIQVNMLECGGIALGLSVCHVISDAYTTALFLNAWASGSRNTGQIVHHPTFNLASVFPPRDITAARPVPAVREANTVSRRFVFDGGAISRLKAINANASRVQVVTSLLWRAMMRVKGSSRPSLAFHAVNLRGRTKNIPIPLDFCGNFCIAALVLSRPYQSSVGLHELVSLTRDAIESAVTRASVLDAHGLMVMMENDLREVKEASEAEDRDVYCFTSWCRMGHYEADFGWGGPSWISSYHVPLNGLTVLMDTRDGDGVEAWVSLDLHNMLLLQQDPDIMAFTSNNHGRVLAVKD